MIAFHKYTVILFLTLTSVFMPALSCEAIEDKETAASAKKQKTYPPDLKSEIEIIEYDLNRPLKGYLGEDAKFRFGADLIYGTADGANQVYSPQVSIGLQGNISENNSFLFDINAAKDFSSHIENVLMNVVIQNHSIKNHTVTFGRMRPQVGVDGAKSSFYLPMINRTQMGRTFGSARDYGINVQGRQKHVQYALGVFNGTRDTLRRNSGGRPEITGMLIGEVMNSEKYGKLALGAGCSNGRRDYDYTVLSSYAKYSYKKLDIESEYQHANGYNGEVHSSAKANGFYVMPVYHFKDNIELTARYDYLDPDIHAANDDSKEYSLGVNYYLANKRIRLSTNYIYSDKFGGDSNRILFLTQFRP